MHCVREEKRHCSRKRKNVVFFSKSSRHLICILLWQKACVNLPLTGAVTDPSCKHDGFGWGTAFCTSARSRDVFRPRHLMVMSRAMLRATFPVHSWKSSAKCWSKRSFWGVVVAVTRLSLLWVLRFQKRHVFLSLSSLQACNGFFGEPSACVKKTRGNVTVRVSGQRRQLRVCTPSEWSVKTVVRRVGKAIVVIDVHVELQRPTWFENDCRFGVGCHQW